MYEYTCEYCELSEENETHAVTKLMYTRPEEYNVNEKRQESLCSPTVPKHKPDKFRLSSRHCELKSIQLKEDTDKVTVLRLKMRKVVKTHAVNSKMNGDK